MTDTVHATPPDPWWERDPRDALLSSLAWLRDGTGDVVDVAGRSQAILDAEYAVRVLRGGSGVVARGCYTGTAARGRWVRVDVQLPGGGTLGTLSAEYGTAQEAALRGLLTAAGVPVRWEGPAARVEAQPPAAGAGA